MVYFSSRLQSDSPKKRHELAVETTMMPVNSNVSKNYGFESSDEELSPEDEAAVR